MDERISLTRNIASNTLLNSSNLLTTAINNGTINDRCYIIQRLNNSIILYSKLLLQQQNNNNSKKYRDPLFKTSKKLIQIILAANTNNTNTANIPIDAAYASVCIDNILQLKSNNTNTTNIAMFTAQQQLELDTIINTILTAIESGKLAASNYRKLILSTEPTLFTKLKLNPHIIQFNSIQELNSNIKFKSNTGKSNKSTNNTNNTTSTNTANSKLINFPIEQLPRINCTKCNSLMSFYCSNCYILLQPIVKSILPIVTLPFKLHIIFHSNVIKSDSTALQCQLLCGNNDNNNINIYYYPTIPAFNRDNTLVVFPTDRAVTINQLANNIINNRDSAISIATPPLNQYESIIFIEGTWPEAELIMKHSNLVQLTTVKLNSTNNSIDTDSTNTNTTVETAFWRYQRYGSNYLSTIESIYQFCNEFSIINNPSIDSHSYDNLLWLFVLSHRRVKNYYIDRPLLLPIVGHSNYSTN